MRALSREKITLIELFVVTDPSEESSGQVICTYETDDNTQGTAPEGQVLGDYGEAAARPGISAHVVAVAVQRLHLRFRAALREELAAGVTDPGQVEEEVRHLLAALR